MTLFRLAFRRIRLYWMENRVLSVVLISAGVLCLISMLVLYANWMPHLRLNSDNDEAFRSFNFLLKAPSRDFASLKNITAHYPVEMLRLEGEYEGQPLASYLVNSPKASIEDAGGSQEEAAAGLQPDEVLAPLDNPAYAGSSTIELAGSTFRVRSYVYSPGLILHPDCFCRTFSFSRILFRTGTQLAPDEKSGLIGELCRNFQIESSVLPDDYASFYAREAPFMVIALILFFSLSLISFSYLIQYMIKSEAKTNWVMRLSGMSYRHLFALSAIELVVFITVSSAIAFIVHRLFWESFFRKINANAVRFLAFRDYGFVFMLALALVLLILLPMAAREGRATLHRLESTL